MTTTITISAEYEQVSEGIFSRAKSGEIGYLDAHRQVRDQWAHEEARLTDQLAACGYELVAKVDAASRYMATITRREGGKTVERYRSTSSSGHESAVRAALQKFNQAKGATE